MSSLTTLWITLAPVLLIAGLELMVVVRAQHRCHVCVPGPGPHSEVERLFPGSTLLPCYQGTEQRICPPDYMGCLTQTKGDQVMRTCVQYRVQGCRSVNGVEYCYCMGDLCNEPPATAELSDDEDLTEASGHEPDSQQTTTHAVVHEAPSTVRPNVTIKSAAGSYNTLCHWLPLALTLTLSLTVWR